MGMTLSPRYAFVYETTGNKSTMNGAVEDYPNYFNPLDYTSPNRYQPTEATMDFTHYSPRTTGGFTLFSLDDCEECGTDCQAPNSMGTHDPEWTLKAAGLKRMDKLPEELGHCDATGTAVCPDCYVEED